MTTQPSTRFIGVLPPEALTARVRRWQAALEHSITTPHVTLKAPGQWSAEQLAACRQAAATFALSRRRWAASEPSANASSF